LLPSLVSWTSNSSYSTPRALVNTHRTAQQSQHTITQQSSQTLKQAWEEEEEEEREEATKGLPFALNALASLAAPFHSCECGPPLASPHLPQIGRRKKKERRNAGLILASLAVEALQGRSLGTVVWLPQV
jgi:hypothetical protein